MSVGAFGQPVDPADRPAGPADPIDGDEPGGVLVLAPVVFTRGPWAGHVAEHTRGSVRMRATCGHECWLSRSGTALLVAGARTVCLECLPGDAAAGQLAGREREAVAVPGALAELGEDFGAGAVERMREWMAAQGITEHPGDVGERR